MGSADAVVSPTTRCERVTRAVALGAGTATSNDVTYATDSGAQHGFDRFETGESGWLAADSTAQTAARQLAWQSFK